jgi:glycosyltransferase involved in cell wall biosynthesis
MPKKKKKHKTPLAKIMQTATALTRKVPVSVNMIVKNCAKQLGECLSSLQNGFLCQDDEIIVVDTGSTDDTIQVAKAFGAKVIARPDLRKDVGALVKEWLPEQYELWGQEGQFDQGCVLDFAEARQVALDASKHDAIFWIDSDDIWEEHQPGSFRSVVDQYWGQRDSFFLNYVYSFDKEDGRVTTMLKRERVVDKRKYYWKGKCHETLIPKDGVATLGPCFFPNLASAIIHKHARGDHRYSDIRNYCIIRSEIEADLAAGRTPDTRSLFYMGNACRGLELHDEALNMYSKVRAASGSRDDVYSCAYYKGLIYLNPNVRRGLDAYDMAFDCIRIKPEDPRGYFLVARACTVLERYEESLHWFGVGRTLPEPTETLHSYDPEHIHSLPLIAAAHAAKELDREDLVDKYVGELVSKRADHPEVQRCQEIVKQWKAGKRLTEAVGSVAHNLAEGTQKEKMDQLTELVSKLNAVPPDLEKQGIGKREPVDERPKGNPDVAFFCGHTAEPWGPENMKTGIGGSEKMVLCMAPRLQKRGARVTVYCNVPPEQRGLHKETGVIWRHWSEFDMKRERDAMILWRGVAMVEMPCPAKKRIVWCHDVQSPAAWTNKRIALLDEAWLLSEFHKSTLGKEVIEKLGDKIRLTRNGLDRSLFEGPAPERKKNRVIYCSSPDRGVLTSIKAFQKAFKDDKAAELHICYGFSPHYYKWALASQYAHVPDVNRDVDLWDYVRSVMRACDNDQRITYHGRISWSDLANLMRSSGVWLYPTRFHEISCMAAMEAQAAGMTIVSVDNFALSETLDWDQPGTYDSVIETAGECLAGVYDLDFDREAKAKWACDKFDFEPLADDWIDRLR